MVHVYASRHTPGLKPGDGDRIGWDIGETVLIVSGRDVGRQFVITSDRRTHDEYPEGFVREGHFVGETTLWAKPENQLWFVDQPTPYSEGSS